MNFLSTPRYNFFLVVAPSLLQFIKLTYSIRELSFFPSSLIQQNLFFASLVAQRLKPLPAMWETWVQSLGWEDPLEKEMTTHSGILPGESHGQRSLVGPRGRKEDTTERLHFHFLCHSGLAPTLEELAVPKKVKEHFIRRLKMKDFEGNGKG